MTDVGGPRRVSTAQEQWHTGTRIKAVAHLSRIVAQRDPMGEPMRQLASWLTSPRAFIEDDHVWLDFVESASSQGLAGLALTSTAGSNAPLWVTNCLRAAASRVAAENLHTLHELARVAHAFEHAGIPLMVLKGAALNLTVYPRRDLRPMSDLDLLVAPQDTYRAIERLESIGYENGVSLIRDDFFPTHHYEKEMILPGPRPVRVDLHAHPWRPMHLAQVVSPEAFWADAVLVPLGDTSILIPHPATMFVHLAAHATFHDCSRLIWLYDLKRVADHCADLLNWNLVIDRARQWHLTLVVRTALDRAQSLFGEICPPQILRQLADAPSTWRDRLTLWHTPHDASSPLLHVACNLLCLRGMKPRAAYLAAMLWPGKNHLAESYPFRHAGWTCCAHGLRAFRAVRRALAVPLSVLRHWVKWPLTQRVPC